jgi:hypothetical protein
VHRQGSTRHRFAPTVSGWEWTTCTGRPLGWYTEPFGDRCSWPIVNAVISWCRHCGRPGALTNEHVPPRSVGNDAPVGLIADPFDLESVVREVAEWDDGHVVGTLDSVCNQRASDWGYVAEYRRWFELFVARARAVTAKENTDPLRGTQPFEIELPYDVHPARFVRHVLGMFLALQATEHLFAQHHVLPELIGPDRLNTSKRRVDGIDIAPLRLYLSTCNASWSYLTTPMLGVETNLGSQGHVLWTPSSSTRSQFNDVLILCLTPFAFVLTTKDGSDLGRDISPWAQWSVDQRPRTNDRRVAVPTADRLQGAIRAMVYPTDYIAR